jgi:hypothetical protein
VTGVQAGWQPYPWQGWCSSVGVRWQVGAGRSTQGRLGAASVMHASVSNSPTSVAHAAVPASVEGWPGVLKDALNRNTCRARATVILNVRRVSRMRMGSFLLHVKWTRA